MDSDLLINKVKNAYHFLHELRDLEAKYGMRITNIKKSPTLNAKVDILTNVDGYEISAPCDDVRPDFDIELQEV